uniref:Nitrogen permease regulator 2-like protein n=1 Tax=Phallusia mammillata TaxID=59560 RepID=A0A6F9DMS4_9ASCI|nr:nitrogen permease regulator 2-like protein [Phallusia mammillata]
MDPAAQLYVKKHPIECMFFSEFHHKQGPRITYQYPDGCITKESGLLEAVINYIIPKPDLQQKLITVNAVGKKVIGCPVCLNNSKYPRNQYVFNFGLVLDNENKSSPCIPLIKKLSTYMVEVEKEDSFVSSEATKSRIPDMLKQMFDQLNKKGSCTISVNESTTIYLKIFPPTSLPPAVYDHHVPILCVDPEDYDANDWDLTTLQVLPFIDGFRHVQKIASTADVDPELTRICVQNLAFYNLVKLISVFQYTNVYITTSKVNLIMDDLEFQKECLNYVARTGHQRPSLRDVMTLYCGLAPGVKVQDLCLRHQDEISRVNEQKLIQFGLIHEMIRKINMYPVTLKPVHHSSSKSNLHKYATGQFSSEEVCCKLGVNQSELHSRLEQDHNIVTLWK